MNFGIWNDNWSAIQEKLKSMLVLWEYLTAWILKLPCTAGWRVRSGHVMPFRQKFKSLGISPKSPPYAQCLAPSAPTFSSPCMESAKFFNLLVTSSPKHTHTHKHKDTYTHSRVGSRFGFKNVFSFKETSQIQNYIKKMSKYENYMARVTSTDELNLL